MDLISTIIPVYNRPIGVISAINSVLAQSYPNVEVIVVDDNSTDATVSAIRSITDARVRLLQHNKNLGPGSARNTGLDAARGRYVAFLDSDDMWRPEKLSLQIGAMQSQGAARAVTCDYLMSHANGWQEIKKASPSDDNIILFGTQAANLSSCMLTLTTSAHATGPFNTVLRYNEDCEWLIRFISQYPDSITSIPVPLVTRAASPIYGHEIRLHSLQTLYRQAAQISGVRRRHRFKARLDLEAAFALHQQGRYGAAYFTLAKSICHSPLPTAWFAKRIMCSTKGQLACPPKSRNPEYQKAKLT